MSQKKDRQTRTLTAPTVADGKAFVTSEDSHEIIAIDTATGKKSWSFTAGGRVDSPPVWDGMAVAGERLYITTQSGGLVCYGSR